MASFPPQFLDEIRTRISVSSVVQRRVKLIRRGREYVGLSPFSNEKSPSFTVSDEKGFYHCFSTQEHGDIFTFLMKTQNLTFPEAVERLAEEAGMEMPRQSREEVEQAQRGTELRDVVEATCGVFENLLHTPEGMRALTYLKGRALSDATIRRFRLGYAPGGNILKSKLTARGMQEAAMLETRVVSPGKDGRESFDFFRDRVIFPICDARGRPVAFGGRIMGEGEPKYLNSPDTPLFHKGQMLYGLHLARDAAADKREIIVCEGYMDVIAMAQAGFTNSVAPLGTALTELQLELLWRMAPEPILCFDGDKAGRAAALRAAERALPMLKPGFSLRFALMPPGKKDPDDVCRTEGPEAMAAILAAAIPLSDVVWRQVVSEHTIDTPERRAALEKAANAKAHQIADGTVQTQYARLFRERLFELFRPSKTFTGKKGGFPLKNRPTPPMVTTAANRPMAPDSQSTRKLRERILMVTLLNHPELWEHVEERLGSTAFLDARLDSLRQTAVIHIAQNTDLDFAGLQAHLADRGFGEELASLLDSGIYVHAGFARPSAPVDQALAGWDHTLTLCQRAELETDLKRAEQELAENPSEQAFATFKALQDQSAAGNDDDGLGDETH